MTEKEMIEASVRYATALDGLFLAQTDLLIRLAVTVGNQPGAAYPMDEVKALMEARDAFKAALPPKAPTPQEGHGR